MNRYRRHIAFLIISACLLLTAGNALCGGRAPTEDEQAVIVTFYYPWYGNPETNGRYRHWNHRVLGDSTNGHQFPGGDDIGANFYPQLGCYSSNDPEVVNTHMNQIKTAGIDIACLSWWGIDSYEDSAVSLILDMAEKNEVKVCFHIEPFPGRTALSTRKAIKYIIDTYGGHPAFYRDSSYGHRPLFFIYDSYLTPAEEWAEVLAPDGAHTIRGTEYDAVVIALWVNPKDGDFVMQGHFDGLYTYFATDGFTYGSTVYNWPQLNEFAAQNDKIFIPCVGPGYNDTRIRPFNEDNYRARDYYAYYDHMFSAAYKISPPFIGITSFNEWHEGTQIEPAVPKKIEDFEYEDYEPLDPNQYLRRTLYWSIHIKIDGMDDRNKVDDCALYLPTGELNLAVYGNIQLLAQCDSAYSGGHERTLVDTFRGWPTHNIGWLGFEGVDVAAIIDLKKDDTVSYLCARFMQNLDYWIFQPEVVTFSVSSDNKNYDVVAEIPNKYSPDRKDKFTEDYEIKLDPHAVRYVKMTARNMGVCPDWHPGAGGKAWLFIDEIVVR